MSTHTVWLACPECDAEFSLEVECVSEGCRESYDSWTGWSPAEGPEFDVTGPETCEACGANLCTRRNEDRAIESAIEAMADVRPRRRHR
jgi:hypothetical protein